MAKFKRNLSILHKKKILYILPVIFFAPLIIILFTKEIVLFPSNSPLDTYCYCDSMTKEGKSTVTEYSIENENITFEYILRKGFEYPYAGFQINLNKDSRFFDAHRYKFLKIKLTPYNTEKISLLCKTFIEDFTVLEDYNTHRFLEKEIDLKKGTNTYQIALKNLKTATWWLDENNITESEIGPPDFSRIINLAIANPDYSDTDKKYKVVISEIIFVKELKLAYITTFIVIVFYFLLYWIIIIINKKTDSTVVIPYKELNVENYIDEDARRIVGLIARKYSDCELTVAKIGEEAGILPTKIPGVLKKKFNLSFKQYLNKIRLSEAKRLLKETDRQITDIAYNVGYKNVTHFHRIFKQVEKISPNEYRKNKVLA